MSESPPHVKSDLFGAHCSGVFGFFGVFFIVAIVLSSFHWNFKC